MRPRRARRSIGVITIAVAGSIVMIYLANDVVLRRLSGILKGYGSNPAGMVWKEVAEPLSAATLSIWVVLAIGRRWHAEAP